MNVALTVAETAYFMEKGEIRFSGATADLLERPDLLRSVFLEGRRARATGGGAARRRRGRRPPATATSRPRSRRGRGAGARRPSTSPGPSAGVRAVDDVSLSVAPGEVVGIIGPNGAGKTTLFDVISGFTPEDSGRILLAGHDISGLSPNQRAKRGLGRSFQDARLFPAMTVDEALAVSLERFVDVEGPRERGAAPARTPTTPSSRSPSASTSSSS